MLPWIISAIYNEVAKDRRANSQAEMLQKLMDPGTPDTPATPGTPAQPGSLYTPPEVLPVSTTSPYAVPQAQHVPGVTPGAADVQYTPGTPAQPGTPAVPGKPAGPLAGNRAFQRAFGDMSRDQIAELFASGTLTKEVLDPKVWASSGEPSLMSGEKVAQMAGMTGPAAEALKGTIWGRNAKGEFTNLYSTPADTSGTGAVIGNRMVNNRTGKVMYEGPAEQKPRATSVVGGNLVDENTGAVVYQGPKDPKAAKPETVKMALAMRAAGKPVAMFGDLDEQTQQYVNSLAPEDAGKALTALESGFSVTTETLPGGGTRTTMGRGARGGGGGSDGPAAGYERSSGTNFADMEKKYTDEAMRGRETLQKLRQQQGLLAGMNTGPLTPGASAVAGVASQLPGFDTAARVAGVDPGGLRQDVSKINTADVLAQEAALTDMEMLRPASDTDRAYLTDLRKLSNKLPDARERVLQAAERVQERREMLPQLMNYYVQSVQTNGGQPTPSGFDSFLQRWANAYPIFTKEAAELDTWKKSGGSK